MKNALYMLTKTMHPLYLFLLLLCCVSCHDNLEELPENRIFTQGTDYSQSENMIQPLLGTYSAFYARGWEQHLLIAVRGDDVNHGGLGDQAPYADTDNFRYDQGYWMYNSLWQTFYADIFDANSAIEQIKLYKEAGANPALADQYIAEAETMRAFLLLQLARNFGAVFTPESSDPASLLVAELPTKNQVLQHISDKMDAAAQSLPDLRPNERADIKGGMTKYTALAIKAIANLELKNYQAVADATGEIIRSGRFHLYPDFYQLFKTPGKLADENLLEFQYSDFGSGQGTRVGFLYAPYGPQGNAYKPVVEGVQGGWGFYEPSIKWIKFMLDRGEQTRLETSVLFSPRGIAEIQKDPDYADLPDYIRNETPDGDRIEDYPRAMFASGKHYLPSTQLIPGRVDYGSNKNFIAIRYAEVLLMYAEALTQGASVTAISADEALNIVRARAGLQPLSGATLEHVMDEKFAEMAMEWGIRYYDMLRLERSSELSYEGRTFTMDKAYLPYPLQQVDQLPVLGQ